MAEGPTERDGTISATGNQFAEMSIRVPGWVIIVVVQVVQTICVVIAMR